MSINLIVRPSDEPMTWDEFRVRTGPFSIALDGYVKEGPRDDEAPPRLNLNHHEGVVRLATRATCAQALMVVRMGLFRRFRDANGPRADVYVNDCDEDVCAAWFILHNAHLARPATNPALNRMIGMVNDLDTTAGAYPYEPDLPTLESLAWIFQPYRAFRTSGRIDRRDSGEFAGIITDVEHRMLEYVAGHGKTLPLDTRYERIGGGPAWTMIKEIGENGRIGAFADGIEAYVVARERSDGSMAYTVGRISQFIPFPVPKILAAMTAAETDKRRRHGGGDTIGGTDRAIGSGLSPQDVERIVNAELTS